MIKLKLQFHNSKRMQTSRSAMKLEKITQTLRSYGVIRILYICIFYSYSLESWIVGDEMVKYEWPKIEQKAAE